MLDSIQYLYVKFIPAYTYWNSIKGRVAFMTYLASFHDLKSIRFQKGDITGYQIDEDGKSTFSFCLPKSSLGRRGV